MNRVLHATSVTVNAKFVAPHDIGQTRLLVAVRILADCRRDLAWQEAGSDRLRNQPTLSGHGAGEYGFLFL